MKHRSFLKSLISISVAFLMLFACLPAAFALPGDKTIGLDDDSEAIYKNTALYNALCSKAHLDSGSTPKGYITESELQALTGTLDLSGCNITKIDGLGCCTSLEGLNLSGNAIVDISLLQSLTGLTKINLSSNKIVDITPLASFTNLTELYLNKNAIEDISPLRFCTKLTTLELNENKITELPLGLTALSNLKVLDLCKNSGLNIDSDISTTLSQLTTLNKLDLTCTGIKDYSFIQNLTNLHYLYINANGMSKDDISKFTTEITPPSQLWELGLSKNDILDSDSQNTLTMIANAFPTLVTLALEECNFSGVALDFEPLLVLPFLKKLDISNNNITVLPLNFWNLTNLTGLILSKNNLLGENSASNLQAIAYNLTDLTKLEMAECNPDGNAPDFSLLKEFTNLVTLGLRDNGIKDTDLSSLCGNLKDLTHLTELDLPYNYITDITPIKDLANLTNLNLDYNYLYTDAGDDATNLAALTKPGRTVSAQNQYQFTIHYNCNPEIGTPSKTQDKLFVGQGFTIATAEPKNPAAYTFAGWDADGKGKNLIPGGLSQEFTTNFPVSSYDLYADAVFNPISYTVTFDSRQGSSIAPVTVQYGTKLNKPADPARSGYFFGGWYKEAACTNPWDFGADKVTGNTTLYARWTVHPPITVTFQKTDIALYGATTGSITVNATGGGSGTFSYSIDNGATWQSSNTFANLAAGTYSVTVCDANNKSNNTTVSVTIDQPGLTWSNTAKKLPAKVNAGAAWVIKDVPAPKGYTLQSEKYVSSNKSIANVDDNGNVTFIKGGKVKITVIYVYTTVKGGKTVTKTVKVVKQITVNQPVSSINLNTASATVMAKKTLKLKAAVSPASATNKKVQWKSSNSKVASVSSAGVVTAKSKGTAVITCTAKDGSKVSANCTVTVY